jgi:SHS2 domain-containing protein
MNKIKKFEFLEHTADVKIRVYGRSIEKVFENSAYAIRRVIIKNKRIKEDKKILSNKNKINKKNANSKNKEKNEIKKRKINVFGKDSLTILYNFLEEIIYLVDAENFVVKKIDKIELKKIKDNFLIVSLIEGEDFSKYKLTNNIKAITYNEMKINKKGDNSFFCEFVLDL